jgi:membrane protease YdiL (CAAX protease family)
LPEIVSRELGNQAGLWVGPLYEALFLISLAIIAAGLCANKNLAGFILAIAALTFSWRIVVPWMESTPVFISASTHVSWGAHFFVLRAIRTVGAICVIATLAGSGITRRELFLCVGNWQAPVQSDIFFRVRRPMTWTRFSLTLLLIFSLLLPPYLFWTLDPRVDYVRRLLFALPWAVATSALNAANEEFQFRSVLLARLTRFVSVREAFLVIAVFFGISHYFGQPSGWGGVLLAGFGGWIWAKSMVETRGFACAFFMHFVLDMFIFCFLAMSATDLSAAWS